MPIADEGGATVLVFAPTGRDASATGEVLARAGIRAVLCADLDMLLARIEAGTSAVFVAEEGLYGRDTAPLARWIAEQPPWSDLPFIVLTSRVDAPSVVAWRQRLVGMLRNVSLLERPVQAITLTSAVQAAVRARRRQHEVRAFLEAQERAAQMLEAMVVDRTRDLERTNAELRRQMAERARIEETLRHIQKMEAMGQLTGGVAHDFNNLLMVITGGLDLLNRPHDEARRRKVIDGMRQAAQRGARLTRQLLTFSRRQALAPETIDLARHIGAMRELLDRSLRGDVQVRLDFAPGLWPVRVDPAELELVLLNLAVNARDAMPDGGTIVVRAANVPALAADGLAGDFVRLAVADTGTGIPPELRERVFEPFFTTKEVGKGSGLGLAQVYGFATQSGGTARIESAEGGGTEVVLLLPRAEGEPAAEPVAASPPAREDGAGNVLLVEDDEEVAVLVAEMLRQLGYSVTRAGSAAAALGALANGRPIDLVFSDVMMPGGMSGVDLVRAVRRRRPGLPVLLTSGYAEAARRDAEGVRVLAKPYRLEELADALRAARI